MRTWLHLWLGPCPGVQVCGCSIGLSTSSHTCGTCPQMAGLLVAARGGGPALPRSESCQMLNSEIEPASVGAVIYRLAELELLREAPARRPSIAPGGLVEQAAVRLMR